MVEAQQSEQATALKEGIWNSACLLPKWEEHMSAEEWRDAIYDMLSTSSKLEEAIDRASGQRYKDHIADPNVKPRDVNHMVVWMSETDMGMDFWTEHPPSSALTMKRTANQTGDGYYYIILNSPQHVRQHIDHLVSQVEAKRKRVADLVTIAERQYNTV